MSYIPMNYDSRSATPVGSSTPRDDPDLSQSDAGDSVYDGIKVTASLSDPEKDFEVMMSEVGESARSFGVWFDTVWYKVLVQCVYSYSLQLW